MLGRASKPNTRAIPYPIRRKKGYFFGKLNSCGKVRDKSNNAPPAIATEKVHKMVRVWVVYRSKSAAEPSENEVAKRIKALFHMN